MNAPEREQLSQFLQQLTSVNLSSKDTDAESLIRAAAAQQPDALYLTVQRCLLLEQALNTSKAQVSELQNQLHTAQSSNKTGFLQNDPWAQAASTNNAPVPGIGNYQPPRNAQPAPAAPQPGFGGGASSFLGNVATTAAGVVAGSFLFQGIENLMGHHHSPWGEHNATNDEHMAENTTTINNYYGDDAASQQAAYDDGLQQADYSIDDSDSFVDDNDDSSWI